MGRRRERERRDHLAADLGALLGEGATAVDGVQREAILELPTHMELSRREHLRRHQRRAIHDFRVHQREVCAVGGHQNLGTGRGRAVVPKALANGNAVCGVETVDVVEVVRALVVQDACPRRPAIGRLPDFSRVRGGVACVEGGATLAKGPYLEAGERATVGLCLESVLLDSHSGRQLVLVRRTVGLHRPRARRDVNRVCRWPCNVAARLLSLEGDLDALVAGAAVRRETRAVGRRHGDASAVVSLDALRSERMDR
mmetsp:Transcript_11378/g.29132  ORF Transcript_11378/g.29132 Transcript_11378/m.29132 type:complete len:256 (+) Transcript_11378:439-1206(+)